MDVEQLFNAVGEKGKIAVSLLLWLSSSLPMHIFSHVYNCCLGSEAVEENVFLSNNK